MVVVAGCLFGIGLLGMWELAMDTLAQVLVALGLYLLVGVPLGIAAARNRTVERLLRPLLDLFQTIPSFVLLAIAIDRMTAAYGQARGSAGQAG